MPASMKRYSLRVIESVFALVIPVAFCQIQVTFIAPLADKSFFAAPVALVAQVFLAAAWAGFIYLQISSPRAAQPGDSKLFLFIPLVGCVAIAALLWHLFQEPILAAWELILLPWVAVFTISVILTVRGFKDFNRPEHSKKTSK